MMYPLVGKTKYFTEGSLDEEFHKYPGCSVGVTPLFIQFTSIIFFVLHVFVWVCVEGR